MSLGSAMIYAHSLDQLHHGEGKNVKEELGRSPKFCWLITTKSSLKSLCMRFYDDLAHNLNVLTVLVH